MSDDLVAFLRARLDQDEAWANNVLEDAASGLNGIARRMLREVESKRAILASHVSGEAGCDWCRYEDICHTVRLLTTVYSDHPDYRAAEWAPEP